MSPIHDYPALFNDSRHMARIPARYEWRLSCLRGSRTMRGINGDGMMAYLAMMAVRLGPLIGFPPGVLPFPGQIPGRGTDGQPL